ncbi:hypothetical protein O181_063537 [Austropuccinia psidii MF-1]|uniref:Uncharacterized protein n=1 Tax=Austropuccinia psidii MF-1 TaxID=1389203 RepID=A0A9Q3EPT3_9BASI|nr:hypothetical protein [Austropuccinia psidii MF-1]
MENPHDQRIKKLVSNCGGESPNENQKVVFFMWIYSCLITGLYPSAQLTFGEGKLYTPQEITVSAQWVQATKAVLGKSHKHFKSALQTHPHSIKAQLFSLYLMRWESTQNQEASNLWVSPLIIPSNSETEEGLVDEVQPLSDICLSGDQETVDESHSHRRPVSIKNKGVVDESDSFSCSGERESAHITFQPRVQVTRPRNPALVSCDIEQSNILTHSRRAVALINSEEEAPCT